MLEGRTRPILTLFIHQVDDLIERLPPGTLSRLVNRVSEVFGLVWGRRSVFRE